MKKEVDALQETDKKMFAEKKFFEMECQVLDFGIQPESGKPIMALHYMFPFTDENISGLK
jgi:hypothetical protein